MDTVYLIMQGKYSDREVCYATLDKDKAERFVRIKNAQNIDTYYDYDIEEYPLDDFEIEEISQDELGVGYWIKVDNGIISIVSTREAVKHNNTYDKQNRIFYCNVWLKEPDAEKAKKMHMICICKRWLKKMDYRIELSSEVNYGRTIINMYGILSHHSRLQSSRYARGFETKRMVAKELSRREI